MSLHPFPKKYHYTSQKQILELLAFSSTEETLLHTKALTSQKLIKLQRMGDVLGMRYLTFFSPLFYYCWNLEFWLFFIFPFFAILWQIDLLICIVDTHIMHCWYVLLICIPIVDTCCWYGLLMHRSVDIRCWRNDILIFRCWW